MSNNEATPEQSDVTVHRPVDVPLSKIRANTWNPNVQAPDTFNALVDHIVSVGFSGAIELRRLPEEEAEAPYEYEVVGGEHRWKAAQILGMKTIPATVYDNWDRDRAEAETVAFNILSGKMDPVKFTASFNRLSATYGAEMTRKMMSFADDAEFKRLYQQTRSALPKELRSKLDEAKDELKTVDDLSVLLHELMRKYGRSVDRSYMWFRYGGKTHMLVTMDKTVMGLVKRITDRSDEAQVDVNEIFATVLKAGMVEWSDGKASTGTEEKPAEGGADESSAETDGGEDAGSEQAEGDETA
jgi:hypothetical protein